MALIKSKRSNIPEDAVLLDEAEALKYQMNTIRKWHKMSDVFTLRYGPYILGTASLLNGMYLNNYFRRKFMLGGYGRLSSYIPICVLPGLLSALMHTELVLRDVLLMQTDQCPVCLQTRAAAIQAGFGLLFPLAIAPVGSATIAVRYCTFNMPYLNEQPREAFNVFRKMFSKIQTKVFYAFLGQAFLGAVITYFEASNLLNIHKELARYEQKMNEEELL